MTSGVQTMGAYWARRYSTVIFTFFCALVVFAAAATEAPAWRSGYALAEDQPDYPGITAHFINRVAKDGGVITMYYPETGNAAVDKTVLAVITKELNNFERDTGVPSPDETRPERAISSNYIIHRPSTTSLGVEFTLCESDGKGFCHKHNLNFSLVDGRLLALEDMFDNPKLALKLMSDWTRRTLPKEVPNLWSKDLLNEATAPTAKNFYHLLATSKGLRIVFDIGQVGPMAVGDPELTMPLAKLAQAGPKPEVWGQQEGTRKTDAPKAAGTPPKPADAAPKPADAAPNGLPHPAGLSTPLQTPLLEKMQVSPEHATFLAPAGGSGLNFACVDAGVSIDRCIYVAPEFISLAENANSDFAFVQGQVSHGAAEGTYVWGLYRTGSGFGSTPPEFVCERCKPGKVIIKKDVITFSKIKQSPFDAQTVDLRFRIADGKLKKIN